MKKIKENQLAKGIELHSSGKFELAQKCYEAVLELDPNHPDANHNMGVLKLNTGDNLEALLCFQKALQEDQSIARFWLSYTKALIMLDRKDEAKGVLDQAIKSGFEESEFFELKNLLNSSKKTPNSYQGKD
ncbi:MAG: tetratricopeptide repeat protein, partial [Rhodospirillaceae bacterium]